MGHKVSLIYNGEEHEVDCKSLGEAKKMFGNSNLVLIVGHRQISDDLWKFSEGGRYFLQGEIRESYDSRVPFSSLLKFDRTQTLFQSIKHCVDPTRENELGEISASPEAREVREEMKNRVQATINRAENAEKRRRFEEQRRGIQQLSLTRNFF